MLIQIGSAGDSPLSGTGGRPAVLEEHGRGELRQVRTVYLEGEAAGDRKEGRPHGPRRSGHDRRDLHLGSPASEDREPRGDRKKQSDNGSSGQGNPGPRRAQRPGFPLGGQRPVAQEGDTQRAAVGCRPRVAKDIDTSPNHAIVPPARGAGKQVCVGQSASGFVQAGVAVLRIPVEEPAATSCHGSTLILEDGLPSLGALQQKDLSVHDPAAAIQPIPLWFGCSRIAGGYPTRRRWQFRLSTSTALPVPAFHARIGVRNCIPQYTCGVPERQLPVGDGCPSVHHRGDDPREVVAGAVQAALDGAQIAPGDLRDLLVGLAVQLPQHENRAVMSG